MADTDQIIVAGDSKIGLGIQSGKGAYNVANKDFRWIPFTSMPYGVNQPISNLPLEGGGDLVPRGTYKAGAWGQGAVQLIPRYVDDLGFILVALMGQDKIATLSGANKAFGKNTDEYTPASAAITFTAAGHILDSTSGLAVFHVGDVIRVTGSVSNNTVFTVTAAAAGDLTVTPAPTAETTGVQCTLRLVSSTTLPADTAATGSHVHTFAFKAKQSDIPYAMVRKMIEGPVPLGEETVDNRIGQMELTLPSVGPMTCAIDLNGRTPTSRNLFYTDPLNSGTPDTNTGKGGWYDAALNGYDDDTAFGLSVDPLSVVKIAGGAIPCTGVVITMANNLQQADAGRIIGDMTPIDFPVLSRAMTIRAQLFMADDYIYRQIFAGSATGRKLSSKIMSGDLDFRSYSPVGISPAATPDTQYALQVLTTDGNVDWSLQGAVDPKPGQPLSLTLMGTVRRPATPGADYVRVRLQNGIASAYPYTA
jgi:hypothetical protein